MPTLEMNGTELALSIMATIVTVLIGIIVSMLRTSQQKFEVRMEAHVHSLRQEIHNCTMQLAVLRTIIITMLPEDKQSRLAELANLGSKFGGSS